MKKKKTTDKTLPVKHLVLIIDKSGSMLSKREDVIGGFNDLLEQQKKIKEYKILMSVTLFDSQSIETILSDVPIKKVNPMTRATYHPYGMTPLWDAIGETIADNSSRKDVLCVIITDGLENCSREYKPKTVKKTIANMKKNKNWGFLFLGVGLEDFQDPLAIGVSDNYKVLDGTLRGAIGQSVSVSAQAFYSTSSVKYTPPDENKST